MRQELIQIEMSIPDPHVKIMILSSEFPPGPGGIGHHAYALAVSLQKKGYEVTVVTISDHSDQNSISTFDADQKFEIVRFPRIGYRTYLKRIQIIHKTITLHKFSHILLTGKFSLWAGIYIKLFFSKIKTISILH